MNKKNMCFGILLILIGIIIAGNNLNLFNIDLFFDGWWTMFIIIPSILGLISDGNKKDSLIGLLIGVILLLICQDLINTRIILKLIFPAILILIGLKVIFKDTINAKISNEIKKITKENKNKKEYCSTFSNQEISFDNEVFEGANLTSVFGGIKLDLRESIIKKDVVINTSCTFGAVDIIVPKDVDVKVSSNSIFGGVDSKIKNKGNKHTIYISATNLFGGVDIK